MIMRAALGLVQCLIVRSGDQLYAIEAAGVSDLSSSDTSPITKTANGGFFKFHEESLPVFHLRSLLSQAAAANAGGNGAVVIWKTPIRDGARAGNHHRFALVVDGVRGQQETLVRSLGRHTARWAGVSGAAELLDGNGALVLDMPE